eukprot:1157487-Pelagomonas_calceolata.AAC.3
MDRALLCRSLCSAPHDHEQNSDWANAPLMCILPLLAHIFQLVCKGQNCTSSKHAHCMHIPAKSAARGRPRPESRSEAPMSCMSASTTCACTAKFRTKQPFLRATARELNANFNIAHFT